MEVQITSSSIQTIQRPDPWRWLMLVAVLGAALMVVLDSFIVNLAVPSILSGLHASFAEVQLVIAGYTLAYSVLLVTGGRLGDLYGRKRIFVLGVGGFTLFSAFCGLAPNVFLLIVFRIAQGTAGALMFPQVIAFIQVSFDPGERPRAFGYYAAISGLGSILGQVFGGFLLAANLFNTGWRSIFLVNVPIGLVALLAALLLIRESRTPKAHGLDYGGIVLLTLTLFLLVFPLIEGASADWPLWALICLLLSVPALLAFLAYEYRVTKQGKVPLVSLVLFRHRRFSAGLLTIALASAFIAGVLFLLTFYLQTILRLTPLQAGFVLMVGSIAFVLASSLSPRVASHLGKRNLSVVAALITLGYALVLLAAQFLVPLWGMPPFLVALFVLGFGMGSLSVLLLSRTLEGIAHDNVGTASGIYTTASQMVGAFGVALIGLMFSALTTSSGSPLRAFATSLLVITLLSIGLSLTILPLSKPFSSQTERNS